MSNNQTKIAIIQFPGTNCEYETQRAVESCGMDADIVRWNTSAKDLSNYDGFVLPGGFSFQDRVRSGAIASKLPLIEQLEMANEQGKPILGICNGCQILAETGLIPGMKNNELMVALTYNHSKGKRVGFVCDWKYVKVKHGASSVFTKGLTEGDVLAIPVNHGEGCFTLNETVVEELNEHAIFQYCTIDGDVVDEYPVNPNGSMFNLAGISNKKGNVFAMMPHPERSISYQQIPKDIVLQRNESGKGAVLTPWKALFEGLHSFARTQKSLA